jgi:CRISPR-associated protein Csm1
LTLEKEDLFPAPAAVLGVQEMPEAGGVIKDPAEWTHMVSDTPLTSDYEALCHGLMADIEALAGQNPDLDLESLILSLMTLLERYTANVPSAANVRHPDISLFDHMRTTAAIAQALYLYGEHEGRFSVDIAGQDETARWLLVCGDFSGIQKFIYNLTNKGAAKGLRGRSFYVGYFCRLCADYILRAMGLTRAGLLYNSGGKFYLLIPAHLRERLYEVRTEINRWLIDEFDGNVFFGLGLAPVSAAMFEQGKMDAAWKTAAEDLEVDRMRKFNELMSPAFFEPAVDFDPTDSCPVCGSRRPEKSGDRCDACAHLERVGIWLKDADAMLTVRGREDAERVSEKLAHRRRLEFKNLDACLFLLAEEEIMVIADIGRIDGECVLINRLADSPFTDLALPGCAVSTQYMGKWNPNRQMRRTEDGEKVPWDFEDYAEAAGGIPRLGVLRMDVDNLGMVFIRGLQFPEREAVTVDGKSREGWGDVIRENGGIKRKSMASISRMVTLSRQLNVFFSGYVPALMEADRFDRCQTIYAGGDDLFVIGSWDQLPDLAKTIREEFREFCCGNPDFSISGGLTLQRGRYPIYKGAKAAGEAEKSGKRVRKIWGPEAGDLAKDGFCFMGVPVAWEDMRHAERIKLLIEEEMRDNRGLLGFLSQVAASNAMRVREIALRKRVPAAEAWREIDFGPWRWRTAYQLRRRYKDDEVRALWSDILFASRVDGEASTIPVYAWLELPLRWADYQNREKGGK